MDCSICRPLPTLHRLPRNTICSACFEAAKTVVSLMNTLDFDHSPFSCQSPMFADLPKIMRSWKLREEELEEKINFLTGQAALYNDEILTDIQLKPGGGGPSVSAHRSILAGRSEILKNMLIPDACKAPASDTISIPDLNYEELESLVEFLYRGNLPLEKVVKNVHALMVAADKYEIPYLVKFCESHMIESMDSTNALEALQIADLCSNQLLRETALSVIAKNMDSVMFSTEFEKFAYKNPHLVVQICRSLLPPGKQDAVAS